MRDLMTSPFRTLGVEHRMRIIYILKCIALMSLQLGSGTALCLSLSVHFINGRAVLLRGLRSLELESVGTYVSFLHRIISGAQLT